MIRYLLLEEWEQNDRAPEDEIEFRTKNREESTENTKRRKTSFPKEYVENQDLYQLVRNKVKTAEE